jgi:hypothetical protein
LVKADPLTAPNVPPDTCDPEIEMPETSPDAMALKVVPPEPSEKRAVVAAAAPEPILPWAADEPEVTAKSVINLFFIWAMEFYPY